MSELADAAWTDESLRETLLKAREQSISPKLVVSYLEEATFTDVDDRRVRAVVEAGLPEFDDASEPPYPKTTDHSPRGLESRYFDVADAAYLSDRELARVVAAGVQRLEGTARAVADAAVDVRWNRSHTTAALRTVTGDPDEPVSEATVRSVVDADLTPASGRAPSTVAVVTNGTYTTDATRIAADEDVHLVDGSALQQWLTRFRLTPDLYGPILEEGELVDTDTDELLADQPELPPPVRDVDLFDLPDRPDPDQQPSEARTESDTEEEPITWIDGPQTGASENGAGSPDTTGTAAGADTTGGGPASGGDPDADLPVSDPETEPGEYGTLYADASEDGDYDAIDELLEQTEEEP